VDESLVPLASSAWLMLLWRPSSVAMLVFRQLLLLLVRLLGLTFFFVFSKKLKILDERYSRMMLEQNRSTYPNFSVYRETRPFDQLLPSKFQSPFLMSRHQSSFISIWLM
jgi:hypothetical protein